MSLLIITPEQISPAAAAVAQDLIARCNAAEGLDLPITVQAGPGGDIVLAYQGDALAGVAQALGASECEICLCVDPSMRRRGVGLALLRAAEEIARRRGAASWVGVADAAARSGAGFAAALGARVVNVEHRLTLDWGAVPVGSAPLPGLAIREAGEADAPALVGVIAAAFDDPEALVERFVGARLGQPRERFMLAELEGAPAAALRVASEATWTYITAFGVRPDLQGRGLGRRLLLHTLAQLRAAGVAQVRIEVEESNAAARALYEAAGFRRTSSYNFLAFPPPPGV